MDNTFTSRLLKWFKAHKRTLPWKVDRDAYKIWISEIILQQTRVEQGTPYYIRFIDRFPTVQDLAKADTDEVLKLWEGLGYYSRARNLHFSAKAIVRELNGEMPKSYAELLKLKGIGPYSAAAIASFAYGERRPVVDGNVVRFIARYLGLFGDKNATKTHNEIRAVLSPLMKGVEAADFNQALMDFGSMVCSPKRASCEACVFQGECYALSKGEVYEFPKRKKTKAKRERYFTFFLWRNKNRIAIEQREGNDIWKGLHQLPLIESTKEDFEMKTHIEIQGENIIPTDFTSFEMTHILSHQKIFVRILHLKNHGVPKENKWHWIAISKLKNYAFPIVLKKHMEEHFFNEK